jgi:hypothetical protein
MRRIFVMCIIAAIGIAAYGQSISLTGKVSSQKGNPIPGAIVKLAGKKLVDTTDSQGAFSLVSTGVKTPHLPLQPAEDAAALFHGAVRLLVTQPSDVRIELFDTRGTLLQRTINRNAAPGEYRYDPTATPFADRMTALRVTIGARTSTFRYCPLTPGRSRASLSAIVLPEEQRLVKVLASVDSLTASAPGFNSKTVTITSYQATVNITLDTSSLGKFSFFVTSLKAVKEFSGSPNGFGGDLRFGKTGDGAGLRGADSICQCIAEKSMPGSKVKVWRAFLSVSKDESGKQVNAIDRIGKGPWYDRLGKVLSPDIKGLLSLRPNADTQIKNDLPNENGVPNHYPDPAAPTQAEDNHHMITGSDTLGKLYKSSATCADWTSVTASGSPRCGFAWPRGMGGGNAAHWISGFDANSCKAEVWVTTSMGGSGIGSNGGYGGFYCFALTP